MEEINSKLQRYDQLLDELGKLASEINKLSIDAEGVDKDLVRKIGHKAFNSWLNLRAPAYTLPPDDAIGLAYALIDEGYIVLTAGNRSIENAFQIDEWSAHHLALLFPKLEKVLARMNIYPMQDSSIADHHYSRRLYEKEQKQKDE